MADPVSVTLMVNGQTSALSVEPRLLLIHALRDVLALTGSHVGCDTSQCGACTILMDGKAVKACALLTVQADGAEIETVEGMAMPDDPLHPIQAAFAEKHGLQCGFCTPGMLMSTKALLAENPRPTRQEIKHALAGNLCRCTGYQNIFLAVETAADRLASQGAAQ